MNHLPPARGLLAALLLASLAACGGGDGSDAASSVQARAINPTAAAATTGDVPTPSLRCAP